MLGGLRIGLVALVEEGFTEPDEEGWIAFESCLDLGAAQGVLEFGLALVDEVFWEFVLGDLG